MIKTYIWSLLFLSLPIILSGQNSQKALVIGIDGCRPDALAAANTPNIDALISNGLFSPDALNDDITISGPGWSAILCGVWSDKHLVTGNNFGGNNYINYPPFFRNVELFNPQLHTASICRWAPVNNNILQGYADFTYNASSDLDVGNQAVNYLTNNDPDVLFLHFDDVDHAGHSYGFDPGVANYINAIEAVDGFVGQVVQAVQQRPDFNNEDWLILVTTDHGGIGFSHGGNTIQEQNVFVIASGNNIPTSEINKETTIINTNIVNCIGDSEELYFDGASDFVQIPDDPVFNFGSNQDFTVECRVRTNVSADVAIVGNKNWQSGNNKGFVLSFKYPSGPEWKVNIGDGSNRADINTGGTIADGEWHTLSVTFDRDGLMSMYEDGVFLSSTSISGIGDITTGQGLFFGADINQSFSYTGAIAEVRVWNTVLGASAINNWHCSPVDNTHPNYGNLVGYWKLNEGTGTNQAIDYAASHHGTISGAEWNDPSTMEVDDYSNTPRLVDVPPTVLTHLCIPVLPEWNYDGSSLIDAPCLLPVQLINFEGKQTSKAINLHWETTEESNTKGFDLEHSLDGVNFTFLSFLVSTTNGHGQYNFQHLSPSFGINYYRLKMMDMDESFAYSKVIALPYSKNTANYLIFPTVVKDLLQIAIEDFEKPLSFEIYDQNGKLVEVLRIEKAFETLNISHLPSGLYYLKEKGAVQNQEFIKV